MISPTYASLVRKQNHFTFPQCPKRCTRQSQHEQVHFCVSSLRLPIPSTHVERLTVEACVLFVIISFGIEEVVDAVTT